LVKNINVASANAKILPFELLNKKKAIMLKKAAQPTCWQAFKNFFSKNKKKLNKMGPKKNKIVTSIDMLENLFVKYDTNLIELLWQKKVFTPIESKKLRDDLTYLIPQIVNYWVCFAPDAKTAMLSDPSTEDVTGFTELILSTCATDLFFSNSLIFTLLSNFFPNEPQYVSINLKIQTLIQAILLVGRQKFEAQNFIKYIKILNLGSTDDLIKQHFKVYEPMIRQLEIPYTSDDFLQDQFGSSINFWTDILEIAKGVGLEHQKPKPWKLDWIKKRLELMNQGLPSFVFVPCQKQTIRNMCIMFIEVGETRIFQTKTKTNFTVCLQLVKPEEFLMRSSGTLVDKFEKRIKLKCQKIMQMEQEGIAEKTKDRARESLHKGFRENYKRSKDRASTV